MKALATAPLRGMKAFTQNFLGQQSWTLTGAGGFGKWYEVRADRNSAVAAVVSSIALVLPEAPLVLSVPGDTGQREILEDHPFIELLDNPNPYTSMPWMMMATLVDYCVTGNAYWMKIRGGTSRIIELRWIPQQLLEPVSPRDGSRFISHYNYYAGAVPTRIPPEDVVHFRFFPNNSQPAKGLSPLEAVRGEITTDEEAMSFAATVLKNLGFPGAVVAPDDGKRLDKKDQEQTKKAFRAAYSGDNRGDVMVASAKTQVHVLSWSPQQLNLRDLRRIPEERISAALNMPAIVAGLGAGLDRSTFANFAEAREMAYESGIIPIQRLIAADITRQLLNEFVAPAARTRVQFDLRDVRVLQEDEDKKTIRIAQQWNSGIITRAEARMALGLEYTPDDEIFKSTLGTVLLGMDGLPIDEPEPTDGEGLPPGSSAPALPAAVEVAEPSANGAT